jgi:hypothetical protein
MGGCSDSKTDGEEIGFMSQRQPRHATTEINASSLTLLSINAAR